MFKKRIVTLLIIFNILIFALIIRIFFLQIIDNINLAKLASIQKITNTTIENERGNIIDKNDIPFTNRDTKIVVVLKSLVLRGKETQLKDICSILNVDYFRIKREIDFKKEPILFEIDDLKKTQLLKLNENGISVINSFKRYNKDTLAKHILGYLNNIDNIGETGMEKYFQKYLNQKNESTVGVVLDAKNNLVEGLGYRLYKSNKVENSLNLRLTLDYHIQKIVEDVLKENNITGAVVVEDVFNGDILAIASEPDFNPNNIDFYLNSDKKELFNRATASYNLGSIFKIIDVAALLESKLYKKNDICNCTGFLKLGDKTFNCYSYESGGHGLIDLNNAFALSCNTYFIDMGLKLGEKRIIDMSRKFGLGSVTGIKDQGVSETAGNINTLKKNITEGDIANISIGQGDIMVTPVQITDIIATIANGGIKNKINILDSFIDNEGNIKINLKNQQSERIISKETSNTLMKLMEKVVSYGTGKKINLEKIGGAAGKTGSAETGQYYSGQKVVHAWFAGYFPKANPKFAISVFVENGKSGGEIAAPIFSKIAEEIIKTVY